MQTTVLYRAVVSVKSFSLAPPHQVYFSFCLSPKDKWIPPLDFTRFFLVVAVVVGVQGITWKQSVCLSRPGYADERGSWRGVYEN